MSNGMKRLLEGIGALILVLLLTAALITCTKPEVTKSDPLEPYWATAVAIDQHLSTSAEQGKFSGSVLVAKDNIIYLSQGYGIEKGHNTPNNPQTQYPIGDLSHLLKLTAIFQLEEKGLLNLSDTISKFMPNYPDGQKITIEKIMMSPVLNQKEIEMVLDNVISNAAKMPTDDYLKMSLFTPNLINDTVKKLDGEYYSTSGDLYLWNRAITNSRTFNKLLQLGNEFGFKSKNIQDKAFAFKSSTDSEGGGAILHNTNENLLIVLLSDNNQNNLEELVTDLTQIALNQK